MGNYFDTDEFLDSIDREDPREWEVCISANGMVCECCGEVMQPWRDGICEVHTSGLREAFGHPDFQFVVETAELDDVCEVLDEMACRVRAGAEYQAGEYVESIIEERNVRLDLQIDLEGQQVLRLVVTDDDGLWPEDEGCDVIYALQIAPTPFLRDINDVKKNLQTLKEMGGDFDA